MWGCRGALCGERRKKKKNENRRREGWSGEGYRYSGVVKLRLEGGNGRRGPLQKKERRRKEIIKRKRKELESDHETKEEFKI